MLHLPRMSHLLPLSHPLQNHLPLSSLLDVVTVFVGLLSITILCSQSLLFLSQLLIVMIFFIRNDIM
jgi:hypothetical protein